MSFSTVSAPVPGPSGLPRPQCLRTHVRDPRAGAVPFGPGGVRQGLAARTVGQKAGLW